MKLDPLAEMHLILREHGWVPEHETWWAEDDDDEDTDYWDWSHPDRPDAWFRTIAEKGDERWSSGPRPTTSAREIVVGNTVASLRRRLRELAKKK